MIKKLWLLIAITFYAFGMQQQPEKEQQSAPPEQIFIKTKDGKLIAISGKTAFVSPVIKTEFDFQKSLNPNFAFDEQNPFETNLFTEEQIKLVLPLIEDIAQRISRNTYNFIQSRLQFALRRQSLDQRIDIATIANIWEISLLMEAAIHPIASELDLMCKQKGFEVCNNIYIKQINPTIQSLIVKNLFESDLPSSSLLKELLSTILSDPRQTSPIAQILFNKNGTILITNTSSKSNKSSLNMWDLKTRSIQSVIDGIPKISSMILSHDGNILAAGGDSQVILYNIESRKKLKTFYSSTRKSLIRNLTFNDENTMLAGINENFKVIIWDLKSTKVLNIINADYFIKNPSFSFIQGYVSNYNIFAIGIYGSIQLYEMPSNTLRNTIHTSNTFNRIVFNSNKALAAVSLADKSKIFHTYEVWDLIQNKLIFNIDNYPSHYNSPDNIALSQDGELLITSKVDKAMGIIKTWDMHNKDPLYQFNATSGFDTYHKEHELIIISPNDAMLAIVTQYHIYILNLRSGALLNTLPVTKSKQVLFSPDNTLLAITTENNNEIILYNLEARFYHYNLEQTLLLLTIAQAKQNKTKFVIQPKTQAEKVYNSLPYFIKEIINPFIEQSSLKLSFRK